VNSSSNLTLPSSFQNITKLSSNHLAIKYLQKRKISYQNYTKYLYYHPSFIDYVKNRNLTNKDKRLVIFAYDENDNLTYMNARALTITKYPRYLTHKLKNSIKLWGLDKLNKNQTIYILEGTFDAMFLPNSLAMFGGFITIQQLNLYLPLNEIKNNIVFVLDNEPYNKNTIEYMNKALKHDFKVFLWPKYLKGIKDINELILKYNLQQTDLTKLINDNIIQGVKGSLMLKQWCLKGG